MATRKMIHHGKVKRQAQALTHREYNPVKGVEEEIELAPPREVEITLPKGTKFGTYPIGQPVMVPDKDQPSLLAHGFTYVGATTKAETNKLGGK